MRNASRRDFLLGLGRSALTSSCAAVFSSPIADRAFAAKAQSKRKAISKEAWMAEWMDAYRATPDELWLGRFREPWYFLLKPISWRPNSEQANQYAAVEVPAGFVTDLTSVPWPLWSGLRPDGEYAYAAIVHDFLYWTQTRPRAVADEILKFGMQDLSVGNFTVAAIYRGVRIGGQSPWNKNAKLRGNGERRILVQWPKATDSWELWRKQPERFAPGGP